jgi:purine nucleosidase
VNNGPVMLDVDTGVDDAAAITYALGLEADLVGVSTVAGNVNIDLSTSNTLKVLSLLGAEDVPVFRGASRPLVAGYVDAAHVHGGNGLGGADLPEALVDEADLTAPEAIIAMAEEFAGDLVIVAVGPYTNIAMAISLRPDLPKLVRQLVVMGGAYFIPGNITPHAEYNIYTDPHAAQQVFAADWQDMIAVGLDVTQQTAITKRMWEAIPQKEEGSAWLMKAIVERTYTERVRSGFFLHDPLTMAVALDESLITTEPFAVDVITEGGERGKTVVSSGGRVRVAMTVEAERFVRDFCSAVNVPYIHDATGVVDSE